MKLKASFVVITLALIFIAGCKKEESNPIDAGQLTGKTWKKTAETVSPAVDVDSDGDADTDVFALKEACEKDNTFTFSTTGVITMDEAANKCTGANQTTAGTWSWNASQTQLTIVFGSFSSTSNVTALSATTLNTQNTDTIGGTPVTFKQTYTAQ